MAAGGGIAHHAQPVEQEADRVGLAQRAAVLGEGRADVGGGAVAVVGQRLDDHRDAGRAVALVAHLGVVRRPPAAPAAFLIARSTVSFGMLASRAAATAARSRGLAAGSGRPVAGGDGDLADQPGEQAAAAGVLRALAVHDVLELRMSGHGPAVRWGGCDEGVLSGLPDGDKPLRRLARGGGSAVATGLKPRSPDRSA